MKEIGKTIGRLISVFVNAGIINGSQAVWILEPLIMNDEVRSNDNGSKEKKEEPGKTLKEEKKEEGGREWQDHFYKKFTKKY